MNEKTTFEIWGCFNRDRKTNPFKYGLPECSERAEKTFAYKDVGPADFTGWEKIANTIIFLEREFPGETFTVVFN